MSLPSNSPTMTLHNQSACSSSRNSSETHANLRPTTPTSVHSSPGECGDNDIIPAYDPDAPRTLILCFDGTGDQFDLDNSNVVKFFSLLKRDDRHEQMVYYQTGIGTYTSPQLFTSFGQTVSQTLDQAVAWNLDSHVMGGYEFLMQNYEAGDKICLFGFSRGAYTARALAGMLHKVGLLPSHNHQQIPFAYRMYTRTDQIGWKQSTAFKKAFSIDVQIEFIGVWDTVCSVGVIPHRLPFTTSNTAIRTFRHALSLDERRAKFKANHYNRPSEWESKLGTHPGDMPRPLLRGASTRRKPEPPKRAPSPSKPSSPSRIAEFMRHTRDATAATLVGSAASTVKGTTAAVVSLEVDVEKHAEEVVVEAGKEVEVAVECVEKTTEVAAEVINHAGTKLWVDARSRFGTLRTLMRKKGKRMSEEEDDFNKTAECKGQTDVKEVWFAGCHCDVGGGSVPDTVQHSLARIPLRWMIRECFRTNTGIRFHAELLKEIGLDPSTLWPVAKTGVEFGPGLTHAPQIPPLMPSPRISFDPPTPLERSQEDVEECVLHAMVDHHAKARGRKLRHARHVSTSTARTLIGSPTTPHKSPYRDHHSEIVVNEEAEEHKDALCEIHDQLSIKPWWWLLELLPIEQRKQMPNNKWKKYTSFNLGRGRTVPPDAEHFFIHKSVKVRMEDPKLHYKPRATWGDLQPIYVD